jgi:hypothetical protein
MSTSVKRPSTSAEDIARLLCSTFEIARESSNVSLLGNKAGASSTSTRPHPTNSSLNGTGRQELRKDAEAPRIKGLGGFVKSDRAKTHPDFNDRRSTAEVT